MPLLTIVVIIVGIVLTVAVINSTNRRLSNIEHLLSERIYPIFSHDELHEQEHEVDVLHIKIQDIKLERTEASREKLQDLRDDYEWELKLWNTMRDINGKVANSLFTVSEAREVWMKLLDEREKSESAKIKSR